MAVDTAAKALNLATRICEQATVLMDAVRRLAALADEHAGSGVEFAPGGEPLDFAGTAMRHIDGDAVNNVLTSALAAQQWLATNFHDDNFDKVRG